MALAHPAALAGPHELEPLGHGVDVAIALSAAYLALDRTRLHTRAERLIETVSSSYSLEFLFRVFEKGQSYMDEEGSLLVILGFAGNAQARKLADKHEANLRKMPFCKADYALSLRRFLIARFDRKLVFLELASLCGWQLLAMVLSLVKLNVYEPYLWVVVVLYAGGLALPAFNWTRSEWMFRELGENVVRMFEKIGEIRATRVTDAIIPPAAPGQAPMPAGIPNS